ncbi:MAG TPA: YncE family protein [Solirubrobacteraceae bacterium]|nr:YncE family protein [Solirubrobacteraceae bacterium]
MLADVKIGAGAGTGAVAVDERTERVYVANGGAWGADPSNPLVSTVTVIDARTDRVVATLKVPSALGPSTGRPNGPGAFAIDEQRNVVYVLGADGTVSVLDGWSNRVLRRFAVPTDPNAFEGAFTPSIVFSDRTAKLYVSVGNTSIDVLDSRTGRVLKTIPDDQAGFLAIDQWTNTIYADHYWDASVSVINGPTDTVTGEIPGVGTPASPNDCYLSNTCTTEGSGLDGLAVDSDLHRSYVVGTNDGSFVTIDTRTRKVIATRKVGGNLFNVAVDPITHRIYAISDLGATMAVIDGFSGRVLDTGIAVGVPPAPPSCDESIEECTVGGLPQGVTVGRTTGRIYVGDYGDITTPDPLGEVVVLEGR